MSNGNGYNGRYLVQDFIDAIPGTGGIITTIAKRVGCTWHTAKKYIDTRPTIQRAYNDECEKLTDAAESIIATMITDKNLSAVKKMAAAKWYLTRKGKDRGYSTRQEVVLSVTELDRAIERELEKMDAGREASIPD